MRTLRLVLMGLLLVAVVLGCSQPGGGSGGTGLAASEIHTVTYNADGATGNPPTDSSAYQLGATVTVLGAGSLTNGTSVFAGWTTSTTGPGASYASGATFSMGNADVNLHSVWIPNDPNGLTLSFSSSGASITITGYSVHLGGPLGSVTIPGGVTSINASAFHNSTTLTSIAIPSSVTSMAIGAFMGCTALTTVTFTAPSSITRIDDQVFNGCTALNGITIPSSVTSIGMQTFYGDTSLTSIAIPSNVITIGGNVFMGCTGLTSITIPPKVTSISDGSFCNDSGLTSITISAGITNIGQSAFQSTGLTSVIIPPGVITIGQGAFASAGNLSSVTVQATIPPSIGNDPFWHCAVGLIIHVPSASLTAYQNNWSGNGYNIQGY
jgi:hypothetical protein